MMSSDKLTQWGILPKWHDKTFADFTNDPEALASVKKYLGKSKQALSEGTGLYLYGANGTGKSLLMNLMMMDLASQGYKVKIVTLSQLITQHADSWYDHDKRAYFNRWVQCTHFVGIEEIGKEFRTEASSLAVTALDTFLRIRVQMKLPVIFTSNVSPSNIEGRYTIDIASMMRELAVPLQVAGEDYRKNIQAANKKKYT